MGECECYDIQQNLWVSLPSLNHKRSSSSVVQFKDRCLFVFGGYPQGLPIEFYNKVSNISEQWGEVILNKGADIMLPFFGGVHCDENNSRIFIFGGG